MMALWQVDTHVHNNMAELFNCRYTNERDRGKSQEKA
jgi:hypothetical protein